MKLNAIFVVCAIILGSPSYGKIPSYIHVCKRTDPEVAKCIRDSVEFIKPQLRLGIPELNVPALEPLRIPDIIISRETGYSAKLTDIDVYGASDFQLTKLKINVPNLVFRIGVVIPLLRLVGNYNINARVLVVPIKGEGKFYANATNCVGNGVLRAELHQVDGEQRIRFTNLDLKLQIGDYNLRLDNLFNGDRVLSQTVNDLLNQNRQDFIGAVAPYVQQRVSQIILEIANKIVTRFNYDEVFPEK